jgi:hypothetical protein
MPIPEVAFRCMNQTIRDYLKRRVRWCFAIGITGWLIFATSIGTRTDNPILNILAVLMFGGAMLTLQWIIKCPRCSVRLGQIAVTLAIPGLKPQPNFCPYCGIGLDEPRLKQLSHEQQGPYNPIK